MDTTLTPHPATGLPRAATAIAVAAWALAVVATGLVVTARAPIDLGTWFFAVDVTVAAVYGTVAAVTLSRRRHPVPWLLALAAIGGGLAALGYAWMVFTSRHPGLPELPLVVQLQNTAWVPGTLALFLVVPWLVRDHVLRWEAIGLVAGVGLVVAMEAQRILLGGRWDPQLYIAVCVFGVITAAVVAWRHRYGPVEERNGLAWLALGTLILAVSFLPLAVPPGVWSVPIATMPALHLASQAVFPAAVLVAVLRGRMWGLGLVVSRATLSALLAVGLLVLYLVVTLVLATILPGQGAAHLIGAGIVVIAVQPARIWLGGRVHRLVYGAAASDPSGLVQRWGNRMGGAGSADDLFTGLARDLGTGLRLESVTLRAPKVAPARWGEPTSTPTSVPLIHRGERVGTLEVTAPAGESLGSRGERMLAEFGAVAAAALAVRQQARQVEQARARLTRARLEERRVIRREIHDGLGPSLAGLRLGLQGARNLLGRDDATAGELLTALQTQLDDLVQQTRELSHHLLPPVLDELGLAAALHELAARHDETELTVEVVTELPPELDAALAAALYGIASEALTNVHRHSGARHAWIEGRLEAGGSLVLEVRDDGCGIPSTAVPGVGTRSMRERAQEQRGTLTVSPRAGGGTVVRAVIPDRSSDE